MKKQPSHETQRHSEFEPTPEELKLALSSKFYVADYYKENLRLYEAKQDLQYASDLEANNLLAKIKAIETKISQLKIEPNDKQTIDSIFAEKEAINNVYEKNLTLTDQQASLLDKEHQLKQELGSEQFKEIIKTVLDRVGSDTFTKFIKDNCQFDLDKASSGIKIEKLVDKFTVTIGKQTLYEPGEVQFRDKFGFLRRNNYLRTDKVIFCLGQTFGKILKEPANWRETITKSDSVLAHKVTSWIDYCGLCLTNPTKAEQISEAAYKLFYERADGIGKNKIGITETKVKDSDIKLDLLADFGLPDTEKSTEYLRDKKQWEEAERYWNNIAKFGGFGVAYAFLTCTAFKGKRIAYWKEKQTIMPKIEFSDRALASLEDKAISEIVQKNDFVDVRDKSLYTLVGTGDKNDKLSLDRRFLLRTMIYADCKTGDYQSWRVHTVLQSTDELYQKTNGEMITQESYNFLSRAHRISNSSKRLGSKPLEYKKINAGSEYQIFDSNQNKFVSKFATETVYIRKSRLEWQVDCLGEFKDENVRGLSKLPKEAFDEMLNSNGDYADLWDRYNSNLKDDNKSDDIYTGRISDYLPEEYTTRLLKSMTNRNSLGKTESMLKMDPDGIAAMAMIISVELINEYKGAKGSDEAVTKLLLSCGLEPSGKRAIVGEHSRSFMREAYQHFRSQFVTDSVYRSFVNYFLRESGVQLTGEFSNSGRAIFAEYNPANDALAEIAPITLPEKPLSEEDQALEAAEDLSVEFDEPQDNEIQEPIINADNEVEDNTNNNLRDDFFTNRTAKEAAADTKILLAGLTGYEKQIDRILQASKLPASIIWPLKKFLLNPEITPTNSRQFLDEADIFDQIILDNPDLAPDKLDILAQTLENTLIQAIPARVRYIDLADMLHDLNIPAYRENCKHCLNHPDFQNQYTTKIKSFLTDNPKYAKEKAIYAVINEDLAELTKQLELDPSSVSRLKLTFNELLAMQVPEDKLSAADKQRGLFTLIPPIEIERLHHLAQERINGQEIRPSDFAAQYLRIIKTAQAILELEASNVKIASEDKDKKKKK